MVILRRLIGYSGYESAHMKILTRLTEIGATIYIQDRKTRKKVPQFSLFPQFN